MKKVILICCIMLAILTLGAVNASDTNATSDSLMIDEDYSIMEESPDESLEISKDSEILSDGNSSGTFSDLNEIIVNSAKNSEIKLDKDYVYSNTTDYNFINGIDINKRLTINGQGHKIDGVNMSRIFAVSVNGVSLKNINFVNSFSNTYAGAIDWWGDRGEIQDCIFENCLSNRNGGAISLGGEASKILNCTFVKCHSNDFAGVLEMGCSDFNISDCNFIDCSAEHAGGAMVIHTNGTLSDCRFINCFSAEGGSAIYTHGEIIIAINDCEFRDCYSKGNAGATIWGGPYKGSIHNSKFINCSTTGGGGAMWCSNYNISYCSFINCSADGGGAVICDKDTNLFKCDFIDCRANGAGALDMGTDCSASDCSFSNCTVNDRGGAIMIGGENCEVLTSNFTDCSAYFGGSIAFQIGVNATKSNRISNCRFVNSRANEGGVISIEGNANSVISNSTFIDCHANNYAGAIYINSVNTNIEGCDFIRCIADNNGAAIVISQKDVAVNGCNFEECKSDYGGAIFIDNDNAIIRNSEFNDNYAYEDGGAIYSVCGGLVENSTFKANHANKGNSIWTNESDFKIKSNRFMLATNENRDDIIYSIPLKDIRNENEVYNGNRLVTVPDIDITYADIVFGENESVNVVLPGNATGKITLTLKNAGNIIKTDTYDLNQGKAGETYSNLGLGIYDIIIDYAGDSNYYDNSKNATFAVRPDVNITQNVVIGGKVEITIDLVGATGKVLLNIDGKKEDMKEIADDKVTFTIDTEKFAARNHTVTFSYSGDSFDENVFNNVDSHTPYEYDLYIQPMNITVKDKVDPKDSAVVAIELPEDAVGTLEVFVNDMYYGVVDIVKGISSLDLSSFKNGQYVITWEYSGDDKYDNFTHKLTLTINRKIVGGNRVVLYSSNAKYSVKVYNKGKLVAGVKVTFVIGGKTYNVKTAKNGIASVVIKKNPGSYKITSKALGISITKKLTVDHIVILKAVKVKKSARSLVLTATLKKVNKRYVVGKWITFKFNGKVLKAKTNKRGIAKVTVKKAVLNKLKVGKKVIYQASYGRDTVKRAAKVNR